MSTKAIRAIIDEFGDMIGTSRSEMGLAAMAELEAIERAAKTMDRWNRDGQKALDPDMARAWTLMESIAKDAK